jgi:hypothetical protein
MPMFFEHPRNDKEIKDFCHFGSYWLLASLK